MKRVGFIPDPTPLATVPAGASQEGRPQAGTVDADISTIAEPDAEPAATAEALIHALERGDLDWRDIVNPTKI